jgi:hypothetical protein
MHPTKTVQNQRDKLVTLLFLTFTFLQSNKVQGQEIRDIQRELSIDLDSVKNAKTYEIRIIPSNSSQTEETHKVTQPNLTVKLKLGHYRLKSRAVDRRGVAGKWGDLGEVDIKFKSPKLLFPKLNSKFAIKAGSEGSLKIPIRWDFFDKNATYEVTIDKQGSKETFKKIQVKGNATECLLPAGIYTISLKPNLPSKEVLLDGESPQPITINILAPQLADPGIKRPEKIPVETAYWNPVEHAESYHVALSKIKSPDGKMLDPAQPMSSTDTAETKFEIPKNLEPGYYKFEVYATAKGYSNSRIKSMTWPVRAPKKKQEPSQIAGSSTKKQPTDPSAVDFDPFPTQFFANIGPVLWTYNFVPDDTNNSFDLTAMTSTALAVDAIVWPLKFSQSAVGLELRLRQTNVSLFEEGDEANPDQETVNVLDRRLGGLFHYRSQSGRLSLDGLLGFGTHQYTYLIQNGAQKNILPKTDNLLEYYLGGAIEYTTQSHNKLGLDLTFHPVSASKAISVSSSSQYTGKFRFMQSLYKDTAYLTYGLENFRTNLHVTAPEFEGEAYLTSSWYRFGLGLALSF